MSEVAVKLGTGGRLVIPGEFRAALGVDTGDTLILVMEEDGLRVLTPEQAVARARALVGRYVPAGRSLAKELLAERRDESDGS